MSLNFEKVAQGASLDFSKSTQGPITNLVINLDWDCSFDADLDACLSLVSSGSSESTPKKGLLTKLFSSKNTSPSSVKAFIYFGDMNATGAKLLKDDRSGNESGGEFILVDLTKIPSDVNTLVPSLLSWDGTSFKDLKSASMKVYLGSKSKIEKPLFEVDLTDLPSSTKTLETGVLKRKGDTWEWTTDIRTSTTSGSSAVSNLRSMAGDR